MEKTLVYLEKRLSIINKDMKRMIVGTDKYLSAYKEIQEIENSIKELNDIKSKQIELFRYLGETNTNITELKIRDVIMNHRFRLANQHE